MAFTSLGVVLISTMTFVLGTFPEFQPESESGVPEEYPEAVMVMGVVDNIAVAFFVMEYTVGRRMKQAVFLHVAAKSRLRAVSRFGKELIFRSRSNPMKRCRTSIRVFIFPGCTFPVGYIPR